MYIKPSENAIWRLNFEILRSLYFIKLLKLKKIKCPQKFDFSTLNGIFRPFNYASTLTDEFYENIFFIISLLILVITFYVGGPGT